MYAYIRMYIDRYVCLYIYVSVCTIYMYTCIDESILVNKLYCAHVGACICLYAL